MGNDIDRELLAPADALSFFYMRGGYQRTNAVMDLHLLAGVGIPKLEGLKAEVLKRRSRNAFNPTSGTLRASYLRRWS